MEIARTRADDARPILRLVRDAFETDWRGLLAVAWGFALAPLLLRVALGEHGGHLIAASMTEAVQVLLTVCGHGALSHRTVERLRGRETNAPDSLRAAVRGMPTMTLLALVAFPALALGTGLLVLPGLFVAALVLPMAPISLLEAKGPLETFRRAVGLTEGERLRLVKAIGGLTSAFLSTCLIPSFCVAALFVTTSWTGGEPPVVTLGFGLLFAAVRVALLVGVSLLSGAIYVWLVDQSGREAGPARF